MPTNHLHTDRATSDPLATDPPATDPPTAPGPSHERLTAHDRAALLQVLTQHVSGDAKERADTAAIAAFVREHDDAHLSSNLAGHITGSAFVLDAARERVLLTHHRKLQRWLQLGGHGDGERDPGAIAAREGREESGIAGLAFHDDLCPLIADGPASGLRRPFDIDIHTIPARRGVPEHLHLDIRYVMVAPPNATLVRAEEESIALAWFSLTAALELGVDPSLRRALVRLKVSLQP